MQAGGVLDPRELIGEHLGDRFQLSHPVFTLMGIFLHTRHRGKGDLDLLGAKFRGPEHPSSCQVGCDLLQQAVRAERAYETHGILLQDTRGFRGGCISARLSRHIRVLRFFSKNFLKAIDLVLSEPVRRIFNFFPAHAGILKQRVRRHTRILEGEILDVGLDDSAVINRQVFRLSHRSLSQSCRFIVFFLKICFPTHIGQGIPITSSTFTIISLSRGKVMEFLNGLLFNIRGLKFGLRTGKLLFWGLVRFALLTLIMVVLTGLILAYHQDIMSLLWAKPESRWLIWLWHVVSWFASLFLIGLSAIVSFVISQVLFSALVMDHMARITEVKITGAVTEPDKLPLWKLFTSVILQEIPRSVIPLVLSLLIMVFGWVTPLGPILTLLSSALAILFLSWDNTDLIPARNLVPFKKRFGFLMKTIPFHLGFGLPFLVPILNILFLSFAPVGATLYYLEKQGIKKRTS